MKLGLSLAYPPKNTPPYTQLSAATTVEIVGMAVLGCGVSQNAKKVLEELLINAFIKFATG